MAKTLDEARKKLDDEYGQVRRHLQKIHDALDKVEKAGPEDDLHGLLDDLEKTVKEARDGGLVGSGANGHRRAEGIPRAQRRQVERPGESARVRSALSLRRIVEIGYVVAIAALTALRRAIPTRSGNGRGLRHWC